MVQEFDRRVAWPHGYEALELEDGWHWKVLSTHRERLLPAMSRIDDVESLPGFRLLGSSMVRCVGALALAGGLQVVVKRYRPRGPTRVLDAKVRRPQWIREWDAAHRVMNRGIPTAVPLALGEKRRWMGASSGAVITLALMGSPSLLEAFSSDEADAPGLDRGVLPDVVGRFVSMLHDRGVLHKDLHGENILVTSRDGSIVLLLLDLHRLTFSRKVSPRRRLWNMAQLLTSLQGKISQREERGILKGYLEASGLALSPPEFGERVERLREMLTRRHERSRSRRCLVESSSFVVCRQNALKVRAKRGFPLERLPRILHEARSVTTLSDTRALKLAPESRVTLSRLPVDGGELLLCVKEYPFRDLSHALSHSLRSSRAKAFWRGWWGSKVRGIPVPEAYLMWEERRLGLLTGCGVIMEAVGQAAGLDRYVSEHFSPPLDSRMLSMKKRLNSQMVALLANLHCKGILHKDLKAGNIMVQEGLDGPRLLLLDLDAMRFKRSISRRDMILNLAQLDASMPTCVGRWERLKFLVSYWRSRGKGEGLRAVAREVEALSLKRCNVEA